ncbi:MAG: MBL fold metallo-hydrolase [Acidobacteria bacterium]|nr:MBL fold metallo-hydrolase [Acidobacteriota bacterium]
MLLFTAAAPPFMKNGFVLACERTREAVLIDPGDEVDELLAVIAEHQLTVIAILLTHAHLDHVSGMGRAVRALRAPVWLHRDDQPLYERAAAQGVMFGLRIEQPPPVDHYYEGDGSWGRFGDYEVAVHHTPGHCPGGVCLAVSRVAEPAGLEGLFVGDTLFAGSIGRTDLPGGNYETLMRSITEVLFRFPDEAVVYSGHGPATTIGRERSTNPFVVEWLAQRGR